MCFFCCQATEAADVTRRRDAFHSEAQPSFMQTSGEEAVTTVTLFMLKHQRCLDMDIIPFNQFNTHSE